METMVAFGPPPRSPRSRNPRPLSPFSNPVEPSSDVLRGLPSAKLRYQLGLPRPRSAGVTGRKRVAASRRAVDSPRVRAEHGGGEERNGSNQSQRIGVACDRRKELGAQLPSRPGSRTNRSTQASRLVGVRKAFLCRTL